MTEKNQTPKFRLDDIAKIPENIMDMMREIVAEISQNSNLQPALAGTKYDFCICHNDCKNDCSRDCGCAGDCFYDCGCDSYGSQCSCEFHCSCDSR